MNEPEVSVHVGYAREMARSLLKDIDKNALPVKLSKVIAEIKKYDLLSVKGMDFDKLDGINMRVGEEYRIYFNKNKHIHRNRFTVAHELGHHVLCHTKKTYSPADFYSSDPEEKEANEFAAELLIPTKMLKQFYREGLKIPDLSQLFCVSPDALSIKIGSCGLLSSKSQKHVDSIWS